jgi:hypothetical protein
MRRIRHGRSGYAERCKPIEQARARFVVDCSRLSDI